MRVLEIHGIVGTGNSSFTSGRPDRGGRDSDLGGIGYAGPEAEAAAKKVLADGLVVTAGNSDDDPNEMSPARGIFVTDSIHAVVDSGHIDGVEIDRHDGRSDTVPKRRTSLSKTSVHEPVLGIHPGPPKKAEHETLPPPPLRPRRTGARRRSSRRTGSYGPGGPGAGRIR
ncbi:MULTISPECIES: hypothetical protein [unclassified Streptomyces]|uniref:hypothetical protein n=1 Tax=unclassified Streptomyces TaxID=2593676 RepID=UPI0035E2C315